MLTLDGLTLDNVTFSGGTVDLGGGLSGVGTDSTIEYARSRTARWGWRPVRR